MENSHLRPPTVAPCPSTVLFEITITASLLFFMAKRSLSLHLRDLCGISPRARELLISSFGANFTRKSRKVFGGSRLGGTARSIGPPLIVFERQVLMSRR